MTGVTLVGSGVLFFCLYLALLCLRFLSLGLGLYRAGGLVTLRGLAGGKVVHWPGCLV